MRAVLALLASVALVVPGCKPPDARVVACRTTNHQVPVSGSQRARVEPLAEGSTLQAVGATWFRVGDYQVSFLGGGSRACMVGGTMLGEWPDSDSWSEWHYRSALRFSQPRFTVVGVHVVNNGDGIKPKDEAGGAAQDFAIEDSWIQHQHDDCIENDYVHSGVIRDNLLDGCYVMFSSRPSSRVDGHGNLVVIDRNVGALEPMRSVYSGPSPGTGGFFKWSDQAPAAALTNNVFMAQRPPNHGTLAPPTGPLLCAGNVIVWEGSGAFPDAGAWRSRCPDTVVTTDAARYDRARAAWLSAHATVR
jgi:hypothetical protein